MGMERVLETIRQERGRQDLKWGGPDHDDRHGPGDWLGYIDSSTEEAWAQLEESDGYPGGHWFSNPESQKEYRKQLIEVAALAVAAVESLDRVDLRGGS